MPETPILPSDLSLTPDLLARNSPRAIRASAFLRQTAGNLENAAFQRAVCEMLGGPEAQGDSHLARTRHCRETVPLLCDALTTGGSTWWSAPGAAPNSHHPYPGGWLIHNATNLSALEGLLTTGNQIRGVAINADLARGAMLLHDWAKPRLLRWEGWQITEAKAELGHHVTAIAEAALRQLPDELLIGMAGIHAGWWAKPEAVARFLEQAAEATDLPRLSRLAQDASIHRWSQLAWTLRQGEAAWYQAAKEAVQFVRPALKEWITSQFPASDSDPLIAIIFGWVDELELAELYARCGTLALVERASGALRGAARSLSMKHS